MLWSLRRELEEAAEAQRSMVEKRIEREKEKEKSVLYKMGGAAGGNNNNNNRLRQLSFATRGDTSSATAATGAGGGRDITSPTTRDYDDAMASEEVAKIESQLSPEQLQLFAQENDTMLKHYEDTLNKVQYVVSPPFREKKRKNKHIYIHTNQLVSISCQ